MAEGSSSMEHHSGNLVEKTEQEEIKDFAKFKALTRGRPQATGGEFSIGPVAARDIARRFPGFPEVNPLATERTEVEYQTALPSSTSEEFVSEQPAEEAAFGEGSVQTSSSVDVLEISTSEGEQADVMGGEGSPDQNCSDSKENYLHLGQIEVGAISFNVPLAISPAHKLSRRFSGTGDFRLRGYEQKLCPSARTATLPHVILPHGFQESTSPSVGLLDISSESRSETFAADSYSDIDHDEDSGDDTDSYNDTDGSSGEAVRRNAGVMCMLRFKDAGSSSARARPGGAATPHRRQQQQQRRLQQQEKQNLKLNKKRQPEEGKRKRRPQVRPKSRGLQDVRPPAAYKTSRDTRRARVGGGSADGGLVAQPPAEAVAVSSAEEVWKSLSEPHQRLVDTWPCREPSGDERQPSCAGGVEDGKAPSREGRRLIEEWLHCSDGSPSVCAARLRRLADGRASWGWPEAKLLARDVADALLTGAIKLLPGPIRDAGSPPSPRVLVIHTNLVDHERCPLGQYTKGLSYLLQTLGARKPSWRRPSRLPGSASATYPHAGKVEACPEAIVVIDARGDTVGVKTKKLLNILVSGGGGGEMRLCDPALSVWPVTIRKILIANTSTVLGAMLMPRRVALNSVMSSPGGDVEGGARKSESESESDQLEVEPRIVCGVRSASSPCLGGNASPSRSFLALSGWSSREWLRYEVGENIARCLPLELGGDLDLRSWSWEGWVGRRMQREDMMTESKLGLLDDSFAPAAWRFLDACHALAESQCTQDYERVLSDALAGGLSVPVTWVKRTLCDVVQAQQAHEPPWRDTFGGSGSGRSGGSGRGGGSGSGAIISRRRSLNREWTQLWKDMGRDVVEIRGVRIDPLADGQGVAEGGVGGGAAGGARDPDGVLTPLAKEIARIGAEGGLTKMPEVECFLAARDILLSTKRTSSGGDVWVCVDRLCGRRDMVVVCPASHEADPLHVAVEFEPESESEPEPEPQLPGPEQSVVLDRRSSTTDPPSPPPSPFRDDDDNSDSSNSDSFPDHHERQQKQQQQVVSTLGQGRRAASRPSALVTSPHSLPRCNCGRWPVCPMSDAPSVPGAGVGGERGAMSGLARGIVSNSRQKSNPAPSVDACSASGKGSDSCRGGGGVSASRCRFAVEETGGSFFWPDEPDRDGQRDDSSDEQIGKDGSCLDPLRSLSERATSGGLRASPRAQTQLLTPSRVPKHQGEMEADVFRPAFESARRPPTPAALRRCRVSPKALLGGGRSPYSGHSRDDSFSFLPSPKAELCGRQSPYGALSRDDSFGPRGPFFPSPKAELGSRVSSRAALRPDGLFRSKSPARPSPNAKVGRRDSSRVAIVRDASFRLRSPSRPSPAARLWGRDSSRAALVHDDVLRPRNSVRPSPKAELGRDGSVGSRGSRSGTTGWVEGGGSSSMQVEDGVRLTPKMIQKQREPPASAAAGVRSFFWGLEACGSPGGLRHASFPAEFIDVMDYDEVEDVRGCVKVTVTTTMSYRICDTNLMNEGDGVIRIVKGVFERVFRVRADGALEGLQPTDGNTLVRMELAN